jgi:hypothetical protein
VFEIGGVVDARRQHGDDRLAVAVRRRAGAERAAQVFRIVLTGCTRTLANSSGNICSIVSGSPACRRRRTACGHCPPARRTRPRRCARGRCRRYGCRCCRAARRRSSSAGRPRSEAIRSTGMRPGAQDLLPVIDVVQKGVDGAHALFDAARQRAHSRAEMMRGTMSKGIRRSSACRPRPVDVEGDARCGGNKTMSRLCLRNGKAMVGKNCAKIRQPARLAGTARAWNCPAGTGALRARGGCAMMAESTEEVSAG